MPPWNSHHGRKRVANPSLQLQRSKILARRHTLVLSKANIQPQTKNAKNYIVITCWNRKWLNYTKKQAATMEFGEAQSVTLINPHALAMQG